jgi:hypothetical protein
MGRQFRLSLTIRLTLLVGIAGVVIGMLGATQVSAVPITDFKPGRIIEDSVFINSTSMTPGQIQSFLNAKMPTCDTWGTKPHGNTTRASYAASRGVSTPFTCLKDYNENGRVAAQIIYDAAQKYTINPQTLLVLLQKEQGLVTDDWPWPMQYKTATGYGCPDTAPCDSQYYGLTNQLDWAAKMFRAIMNNSPTWYTPYILGDNFIRWSPNSSCGGTNVTIQNRATQALYNYTPYQPNQAALNAEYGTGDGCSAYGNRNFYLYFRDWFGYNKGPAAFKTSTSSTIYLPVEGYKLSVPYMAAMQDYGISADSIATVSQAYVDSFQQPPAGSGISSSIGHFVKSNKDEDEDGGAIYLISRGKRYQVQTMTQFHNFGFSESDIKYLPLGYIFSMDSGGTLSDFASSPYGSVFKIANTTKRILFEYSTYIAQNPSDRATPLSYYLADKIPSGTPITDKPIMVKGRNSDEVSVYQNDKYYPVPNFETLSCWNLDSPATAPTFRLPQDDYIATYTPQTGLSCTGIIDNATQLLSGAQRVIAPASYNIPAASLPADLNGLAKKLPLRSEQLRAYVKTPSSAAVWYLSSGHRSVVPTYRSFQQLGLSASSIDVVSETTLSRLPEQGMKLADGQLVKSPDTPAVYVITGDQRVAYASSASFTNYLNDWDAIDTLPLPGLDLSYPDTGQSVKDILADKANAKTYLVSPGTCYVLDTGKLTAMGKTSASVADAQAYDATSFKQLSLSRCKEGTYFIKNASQSLVYWINDGQKHALNTYAAMLSKNNGNSPTVMVVGDSLLNEIPTGQSYN